MFLQILAVACGGVFIAAVVREIRSEREARRSDERPEGKRPRAPKAENSPPGEGGAA